MAIAVDNDAVFRQHLAHGYNLFAGAGFSVGATGSHGKLPIGDRFADDLRSRFQLDSNRRLSLPQVYAIAERSDPEALRRLVEETFTVVSFDERYKTLNKIAPKCILTTNVDDLFHLIFQSEKAYFLNDVYRTGAPRSRRSAIDLVQVHGSVRDPDREMVFGPFDLAASAAIDPDRWHYIRDKISAFPTLYWGYGFSDSGTLQAMRSSSPSRPVIGEAWVQVRPEQGHDGLVDYYRALDYNVIVGDTSELLDYLVELPIPTLNASSGATQVSNIPTISEVPNRPIEDFFAGIAPSWSDVIGDRVYRTQHYSRIAERIAARKNTIIAGIPGCGKSTLLMQLAAHLNTPTPKAFYENLGFDEAAMLSNRIGDDSLILFLDNVASDIRVLEALKNPNLVVVGADREFPISSVRHRLSGMSYEIIGVTQQDRKDLVSVWKTIPPRLRRKTMNLPRTTYGRDPSLYEFVQANVRDASISKRLLEHLNELYVADPSKAELLILACYMMKSRSSISTDLAFAFFRDEEIEYATLIEDVRDIGELLHEDESFGADQDYFTARSAIVAEEVLNGCRSSVLKAVLLNLHHNVAITRIPQFDVFRRRGYDQNVFSRAFGSVKEGVELYEHIMDRDPSPYVLQQKALYLSKHGHHEEAFRAIDEARNSWRRGRRGGTNWRIDASYHKILFLANIDKVEEYSDALDLCRRALSGLVECYDRDYRQGQHALDYSNCALQFSFLESAPDDEAAANLERGREMLRTVRKTESYLVGPKYLLRDIERRLGQLG